MHRDDDRLSALAAANTNDGLLAYLQGNGATSSNLSLAWREFLDAKGFATGNTADDLFSYLGSLGYDGALSDRVARWWAAL